MNTNFSVGEIESKMNLKKKEEIAPARRIY